MNVRKVKILLNSTLKLKGFISFVIVILTSDVKEVGRP